MLRSDLAQKSLCLVLGVAVGVFALSAMPRTVAIATPVGFLPWFKEAGSIGAGLFLWDAVVTYGLGVGLPALVALLVAFRYFVAATVGSALVFMGGVLLTIHVLAPLRFGDSPAIALQRPWFLYSLEVSLVAAALAALLIARRRQPRMPHPAKSLGAI